MMDKCDNCPKTNRIIRECENNIEVNLIEYETLQLDLIDAIKDFYAYDKELLDRSVNEVCITSHIFHYFMLRYREKYSFYNIDPEYNRNGIGAKYYCGNNYAKPDLIIHKRNCNKHNLLYAEFKVLRPLHSCHDEEKIIRFVSNDFGEENQSPVKPYRYSYGVSVLLEFNRVSLRWFRNGEKAFFVENVFETKLWRCINGLKNAKE